MSKKCSILKIEKFFIGELSEEEKSELLNHIEECNECAESFNKFKVEQEEFLRVYPYKEFELNYREIRGEDKPEHYRLIGKPLFAYIFLFFFVFLGSFGVYRILNLRNSDELRWKGSEEKLANIDAFERKNGERYAFIVGQNNGGSSVKELRYAKKDASDLAELLNKYGSFKKENLRILFDTDSLQMVKSLDAFTKDIKHKLKRERALFLLYYTGHADRHGLLLKNTHFSFKLLKDMVERISQNGGLAVSIIDACQSGVMVAFKGENNEIDPFFYSNKTSLEGEVWIASSAADEKAQESENLRSSIFSFFFLTGLKGSADVSGDRKVTLNEAYQYAYRKTLETGAMTSGILQHPVYRFNIYGEGEIIITDLSINTGGIIIGNNCSGSFIVLSEDYANIYADFRKKIGSEVFIALPEGEYIIINAQNNNGANIGTYFFNISEKRRIYCSTDSLKPSIYNRIMRSKKE